MPDKTAEQIAEALADSLLAPLRAVGELLAGEVDALRFRVTELEGATATRFEELEARVHTAEAATLRGVSEELHS